MENEKLYVGHTPVLLNEVIEYLKLDSSEQFIDATLDGGGHTLEILSRFPNIQVLGIEYDPIEFKEFKNAIQDNGYGDRLITVNDSYVNIVEIAKEKNIQPDAILFDLGVSSWHYEVSGRGFSFQKNEMLDMRFNPQIESLTAAELINTASEEELERILAEFGEEQFSKFIAHGIVEARQNKPILMTYDLVGLIKGVVPAWYRRKKINPATKTFQAIRIAVNDELGNIRSGVRQAMELLNSGGRVAVISFHGLEDKLVREAFKEYVEGGKVKWVTKETVKPTWAEIKNNPRARSAKMKIAEKV